MNRKLQSFLVEALAMNTFSLFIAIPNELLIAGMDLRTHVRTRLLAAITNTILGRPYGIYRDLMVAKICKGRTTFFLNYVADTLAFATFQLPLYWFNMAVGGKATIKEMLLASISVTIISGLLGRPYGVYLEFMRRVFKVNQRSENTEIIER